MDTKIQYLQSLEYLSKDEIKDLLQGWTELEVLLKPEDLVKYLELK